MKVWLQNTALLSAALLLSACSTTPSTTGEKMESPESLNAKSVALYGTFSPENPGGKPVPPTTRTLAELEQLPLYQFSEADIDLYLAGLKTRIPDFRERVVALGRKAIGQPYELYLLGESPYETHDPQPTYCLDRSDCVVFAEHVYAMALSNDWPTFHKTLQKIRYHDNKISVATRNHFTEADWNIQNGWLVEDITNRIAGGKPAVYTQKVNRQNFLKKRYKLDVEIPTETVTVEYVPLDQFPAVLPQLENGDFVNVIVGKDGGYWATHVGLISVAEDGTRNFLHSTEPAVREEPFMTYVERGLKRAADAKEKGENKAILYGFKFLRPHSDVDSRTITASK